MSQDWVKAIGKKLRDDLGDCPTLPQELVEALARLEKAQQAGNFGGQASAAKAGAAIEHRTQERVVPGASAKYPPR